MNPDKHFLHIEQAHFEEWTVGSGVSRQIVKFNVQSLGDPLEIDALLNRNTKNRWQHWEHGAGWAVTGVDPTTGKLTYEGAQFKPDTPVQRKVDGVAKFKRDGSPDYQKYFSASGCESQPLFLDTGEPDYWSRVMGNVTQRLLITEGAKKAGAVLTTGEACISLPGVTNGQRKGRLKKSLELFCQSGRTIVLAFDSDMFHNSNVCKALNKLGALLTTRGVLVHVLMLSRATKGIDDFIVAYGHEAFKQLLDQALTLEEWRDQYVIHPEREVKTTAADSLDAEENYQLKAQAALFSDRPWVSIDGVMYQWCGTHYEVQSEAAIKRKISEWCSVTAVSSSEGWRYSYATATHIDNIFAWVQRRFAIDPATINPPGMNSLNGVLRIQWDRNLPSWQLVKHDPKIVYTYVGEFSFNPEADPSACDRLLACLDAPQREIFIKTLAASLDLKTIRLFRGRGIRALLCRGDGNNGKDSLREAVALLYGIGVVNCTVSDFQTYDTGRKFTLAKLDQARISWSSENSSINQLDSLQSLKAAITGETLDFELKQQTERPMNPCTVFFFNINNAPNLQASLEAIQSRWAVLSFNKTFKVNADPSRGEIEADPRFRYDSNFLKMEVVPALLNKMLAALPEVAMESINYNSTEQALADIQEETNHLWAFAREVGLNYQLGGRVYINDLWESLRDWYIKNGTLAIVSDGKGKEKQEWHDQPRRGDKNVKAPNQIYQRFSELFPKVKRERDNSTPDRRGQFYLSGLGFGHPNEMAQSLPEETSVVEQIINLFDKLSPEEQESLKKSLSSKSAKLLRNVSHPDTIGDTASQVASQTASSMVVPASRNASVSNSSVSGASDSVVAMGIVGDNTIDNSSTKNFPASTDIPLKVGDRVAHANPKEKSYNWHGEIVELTPPTAKVRWEERKEMRGGDILSDQLSNLRLISDS